MPTDTVSWHDIPLGGSVAAGRAAEVARRIHFVDERIRDFRLVLADDRLHGVRVSLPAAVPVDAVAAKLVRMVADEVLAQLPERETVLWRSSAAGPVARSVFDELLAAGLAVAAGPGRVALAAPLLGLVDRLDGVLRGIAVGGFGAAEYRYPALLPTAIVRRSGYLTAFPQHVLHATRLRADLDNYRDFRAEQATADAPLLHRCAEPELTLPPTMCYHTFAQYAGRTLTAERTTVTARGPSFRYEAAYAHGLERLWDFTIRETVFLGSREQCHAGREEFAALAAGLLDRWGMTARLEVAHDPFLGDRRAAEQIAAQRLHALKYELRADVGAGRTVAVGSFNLHHRHFTDAFEISGADGPDRPHSSCVGFGLERLAYAVLCHFGLDDRDWPAELRPGREGEP